MVVDTLTNSENTMVGIGEVLWDLLPDGKQLGGSPMNVVYHCQMAGIPSTIVSAIGQDDLGHQILDRMAELQLSTHYLQQYNDRKTGTVTVTLKDGIPDFTIHHDVAWDFIQWGDKLKTLAQQTTAVAFGSLSQRHSVSNACLQSFLDHMPMDSLKVFDINLRQSFHSKDLLELCLQKATVLKINNEELPVLADYLGLKSGIDNQLKQLQDIYSLDLIAYTQGEQGSLLINQHESSQIMAPKLVVKDTVGAGDAFTGVMIAGILQNKSLPQIHEEATTIAAWVCTQDGAMPDYRNRISPN